MVFRAIDPVLFLVVLERENTRETTECYNENENIHLTLAAIQFKKLLLEIVSIIGTAVFKMKSQMYTDEIKPSTVATLIGLRDVQFNTAFVGGKINGDTKIKRLEELKYSNVLRFFTYKNTRYKSYDESLTKILTTTRVLIKNIYFERQYLDSNFKQLH